MTARCTARAAGKVNIHLSVGPLAEDGYHPLATIFQSVALYETVTAIRQEGGGIQVTVRGTPTVPVQDGDVPLDETNLAVRAAQALAARFSVAHGVDLEIVKGVPIAGGMAGGSADAAAALVACNEVWGIGATKEELSDVAAQIGADVPFCLHGHTAVGLGRGDQLTPAMTRGQFHWVFATQSDGLSTPEVYRQFDRQMAQHDPSDHEPRLNHDAMAALMAGDPHALGAALHNDLQEAAVALAPHLEAVMATAREAEALGVIVSGSGPTVAALARSRQHALAVAAHIRAAEAAAIVVPASGPVGGAVILRGAADES